ncbi:MAG TPA: DNA polymerase III subunit gamma/tau [Micropepsaceae bacterium]|nr:DNA polymerase III subunit gamma/tau [Micropepsaceae bacterium]
MDEPQEPRLGLDDPVPGNAVAARAEPYRVLARKYRPQNFTGLIGQDALVRTLRNAFASGRIAHAFMLTGVRGVGKTTTARIIARALNCVGPDGKRTTPTIDPCGLCEPCRSIAESRFVDVQEMDAASRTGIDDIREIIEGTRYAPAAARYKVYIIDEVHMLSKQAFNGLLKTLEEPPPHVKFIFATTEIRKVPVTVLSRCQRFDLRRIETEVLSAHLAGIAEKEHIAIESAALSLIARAAEGSVRDALSLLDQAIAHHAGENASAITGDSVRAMLGLADRGRVLDLFEKLMGGEIPLALAEFKSLYDRGADPLVVMQDLLETTHFLTRVKVAPGAEGFFDGGSGEAARAVTMAGKLNVPALTRAWQMLLKGLIEVRDASNPYPAAEMALVRLAYAADLPPTERLVRSLRESDSAPAAPQAMPPRGSGGAPRAQAHALLSEEPKPRREDAPAPSLSAPRIEIRALEDIVALAKEKGARLLATQLETNVHLVSLERGRIQFRPNSQAPTTLANDVAQRLRDWTSERWIVTLASEGGAPTIAEARIAAERAKKDAVSQEPFVRAVLDAFPGAEIVAVREREIPEPIPMPSDEEPN